MTFWFPALVLSVIVSAILFASRTNKLKPIFKWLPVPLWCYLLPLLLSAVGWLPKETLPYRTLSNQLLPIALALLLLGVNLPAVIRTGIKALGAYFVSAVGIMLGVMVSVWIFRTHLSPDAWMGAGTLTATWIGGSMNLLSLRSILGTPESIFAPLIVVDAVVAYTWMAILVALSGSQTSINNWLRVPSSELESFDKGSDELHSQYTNTHSPKYSLLGCIAITLLIVIIVRLLAKAMPVGGFVTSSLGWVVLLTTTFSLLFSLFPVIRRIGASGSTLGYPVLYVVLAATGAQASLEALASAPIWLGIGFMTVIIQGIILLLVGRIARIPIGIMATASQANIGGFVSGPLVGAIYHKNLAPIGLLLAMMGNVFGTYLGVIAAIGTKFITSG